MDKFVEQTLLSAFSDSSPKENISHSRMPYDQTSLSEVYRLSKMLSGAIHFTGRNVCGMPEKVFKHRLTVVCDSTAMNVAKDNLRFLWRRSCCHA